MREKEAATRIIYVRHGLTDFPTNRIYCDDREDPVLNERGIQQARDAASLLAQQAVDAIYASPSGRTRMTADEIARVTGWESLKWRRFASGALEFGMGFISTISRSVIRRNIRPGSVTPPAILRRAETMEALLQRAGSAITQIAREHPNQTVVVVSHVGPIRVCVAEALKIPLAWYRQLHIDYGSLTQVDYGRSQNNMIYANLTRVLFQP